MWNLWKKLKEESVESIPTKQEYVYTIMAFKSNHSQVWNAATAELAIDIQNKVAKKYSGYNVSITRLKVIKTEDELKL